MRVSKRFVDRAKPALRGYQKAFESAKARDVNESDTRIIISDFIADVLGFDKYSELTTELAVKSTFCDIAIKFKGKLKFLIECKSAGTNLKGNHLRQATDYAANEGVEWVILTNGPEWHVHRMRFEQPICTDEVFGFNLLDPDIKIVELLERLYLISREGTAATAIDEYWEQKEATSRFVIAQLLLSDTVLTTLRRQLRRMYPGVKVTEEELAQLLGSEVLKRDVLDGERAAEATKIVRRLARRLAKAAVSPASAVALAPVA
jgi:type I restriction and modification enzyme subunit R-like protein